MLTKKFLHPVTGQLVTVSYTESPQHVVLVDTQHTIDKYMERETTKLQVTLYCGTAADAAKCFQMFDKACAKKLVNDSDNFRSYIYERLRVYVPPSN